MASKRIKCAGCGRRIPDSVPDIVVRKLDEEHKRRYYHQTPACVAVAQVMIKAAPPATWRMTYRHIDAGAN